MKRILSVLSVLLISAAVASAQDLITKKNGEDIMAKVLEIDNANVRYHLYDEPDGVIYTMPKSDILMIRYQSGRNEVFNTAQASGYNRVPAVNIRPGMKYKELKKIYNYKDYEASFVERRRKPGGCGVASFFIPGLGQLIEGEVGRGLAWLGGAVVSDIMTFVGISELYGRDEFGPEHLAIALGSAGGIICSIWSTVEAVRIAKVQNLYYSDLKQRQLSMELYPSVDYIKFGNAVQPTAGFTLAMKF